VQPSDGSAIDTPALVNFSTSTASSRWEARASERANRGGRILAFHLARDVEIEKHPGPFRKTEVRAPSGGIGGRTMGSGIRTTGTGDHAA
jgi:hypothetical protein